MEKNLEAINKIIAELSHKDWKAAHDALIKKKGKYNKKTGMPNRVKSYTLGVDTKEAIDIRNAYVKDEITEEEYKAWCLRWNLNKAMDDMMKKIK